MGLKNNIIIIWQCIFETIFAGSLVRFMDNWLSVLTPETNKMINADMEKFSGKIAWFRKIRESDK